MTGKELSQRVIGIVVVVVSVALVYASCKPQPQPSVMSVSTRAVAVSPDYGGYRPHYQGYGVTTAGGRGGVVIKVTNLNDSGVGSLRAALVPATCGPRFIVFEVSGTIPLTSSMFVTCPFFTLAGQTAPSPGILVRNLAIYFDTHDFVVQHLRFRRGDTNPDSEDVIYLRNNVWNVVLDHVSMSWGTHGLLDVNAWTGPQAHDVAVLDSIQSEGLKKPNPTTPAANVPFGTGMVTMQSQDGTVTLARNLFAHQGNRNPWIASGNRVSGYNNVAYDVGGVPNDDGLLGYLQLVGNGYPDFPFEVVWVANVALPGVDTHADTHPVKIDLSAAQNSKGFQLYLGDNVGPFMTPTNQWTGVTYRTSATEAGVRLDVIPDWHKAMNYAVLPGAQAQAWVLAHVGARPLDRDAVDTRIVADVTNGTGSSITTPGDVGGYPTLAVNSRPYTVPANANAIAAGQTFRTNIEMNLETMAQAVEPQAVIPPEPPTPTPTECPSGFSKQPLLVRDAITLQPMTIYTCVKAQP